MPEAGITVETGVGTARGLSEGEERI